MKRILLFAPLLASCSHRPHVAAVRQPATHSSALARTPVEQQIVNAVAAGDGDYELRVLRARLDADPRNLNTRLELAGRYQKLGFPEIAIEHCRLACERDPESDEAHIALARMLREAARPAEAAAMLTTYTSRNANAGAGVWAWLGLVRDDGEDWKAGEAAHRKALTLAPDRDDFHNNLGYCLLRQDRRQEAAAEFRAALKLHPHSVISENNLALALAPDGAESGEAVALLQSVADPATAHNNMAVALLEAGKYAEAQKEIDVALRYNRSHSAALSNLRLLSELESHPAVIEVPARTEGRWPRFVSAWRHLWGSDVPPGRKIIDSGSPVASR